MDRRANPRAECARRRRRAGHGVDCHGTDDDLAARHRPAARQPAYVDLSQLTVADLAGIEFHNDGDLPAELEHSGTGCAALYLWTRER